MLKQKVWVIIVGIFFLSHYFSCMIIHADSGEMEQVISVLETSEVPDYTLDALKRFSVLIDNHTWKKTPRSQKDRMIKAFIKQLKHGLRVAEVGESEEAAQYVKLLGEIAGKLNDERVNSVLVEGVTVGSYSKALAKIGEPVIEPLLKKYRENRLGEKMLILKIFGDMGFENMKSHRETVKKMIIGELKDKKPAIRMSATRALSKSSDEDVIPLIEEAENNDSYFMSVDAATGTWSGAGVHKRYLVRENASAALKTLRDNVKIKINKQLQSGTTQAPE